MNIFRIPQVLLLLATLAVLSGCVSVPGNGGMSSKNIDKAVRDRVAAGMEYLRDERPQDARRHFSRALKLDDDSALAHNAMALLSRYEGDTEKEEEHYKKALKADRNYSTARNNLGILLYRQGRYREAAREFRKAANDPDYSSRGKAFANLGEALLALEDREGAKKALKRAVRLNASVSRPQLELARIYFEEQNYRLARQYYDAYVQTVDIQPPEALWLGIRLAHRFQDKDLQSSYEMVLKRLYPATPQFEEWQQWRAEQNNENTSGGNG